MHLLPPQFEMDPTLLILSFAVLAVAGLICRLSNHTTTDRPIRKI